MCVYMRVCVHACAHARARVCVCLSHFVAWKRGLPPKFACSLSLIVVDKIRTHYSRFCAPVWLVLLILRASALCTCFHVNPAPVFISMQSHELYLNQEPQQTALLKCRVCSMSHSRLAIAGAHPIQIYSPSLHFDPCSLLPTPFYAPSHLWYNLTS